MYLRGSEHDVISSLIRGLLEHGIDMQLPEEDVRNALNNAGILMEDGETRELMDLIIEHRTTCEDCMSHYDSNGVPLAEGEVAMHHHPKPTLTIV